MRGAGRKRKNQDDTTNRMSLTESRMREDAASDQLKSGSLDQQRYAAIMGFERGSGAPDTSTPVARKAAEKAAERRVVRKKAAKKKAAKKKAAARNGGSSSSESPTPEKRSFFGKMFENTGKPNKRRFQRGARMTPGESRKYEAAMERWKKKQEEKPGKAGGGRVVAKKAAKKRAARKGIPSMRNRSKDEKEKAAVKRGVKLAGGGRVVARKGAANKNKAVRAKDSGSKTARNTVAAKEAARKRGVASGIGRASTKKRMPRRP